MADIMTAFEFSVLKLRRIVAVAGNYPGVQGDENDDPLIFTKDHTSVALSGDPLHLGELESWGEPELAVVLGDYPRSLSARHIGDAILGYTVANDVTARDGTERDHHLARYKCARDMMVLGSLPDPAFRPDGQIIRGLQDGRLIREGRLSEMRRSPVELISWIGTWMDWGPGDVILTGAPPRVGERVFLNDGAKYRCEVDGLDHIENQFRL